ncbi:hypothetical protein BC939DRAFT_505264 [Gamsiella multidivaricata]|uniref:uncharacterized protein n=1 Tax=Gamsiella multidivaricata TaxID=101098 RepID=UPI0022204F4C|nr:uncharacterized protein BC939DRAFT_505264 [Gamsiella multidivaricata]KAG0348805.1 hypothetical protein BGZ54_004532 [Gamsiella multidivaricata]KAI7820001.1 hypothetical protein BC939DRAFT_505264 [Gamsiella multidivaricata]
MASNGVNQEALYIALEYVSIVLFLFLLFHCAYRGINYLLQIFCVAAIINNINESILVLYYGGQDLAPVRGTDACIVSAFFEQYVPIVLTLLAACMGINIWRLIVWQSKRTERQMLPWYCLFAFGVPFVSVVIDIILLRNEPEWMAYPRRYFCDLKETNVTLATFAIPMVVGAFAGILFTLCLVRHYHQIRRTVNLSGLNTNRIVFELSHCIRLIIFCLSFGAIVAMAILPRLIQMNTVHPNYDESSKLSTFSDYSGSLVGYFIFLVFGTTKESMRTLWMILSTCWRFCTCTRVRRRRREAQDAESGGDQDTPSVNSLSFQDTMMLNSNASTSSRIPEPAPADYTNSSTNSQAYPKTAGAERMESHRGQEEPREQAA